MNNEQRPREVGETIETGDTCRTVDGHTVPATNSVGRLVRRENFGFVHTTTPHSTEYLKAKADRIRHTPSEAYEVLSWNP